jgi:hypothetical protein
MSSLADRVRERWLAKGLEVPSGASEVQMAEFELHNGIILPTDLKEFYQQVNGIETTYIGNDFISFYPLGKVQRVNRRFELKSIELYENIFVFADQLWGLPFYGIKLHSMKFCNINEIYNIHYERMKFEIHPSINRETGVPLVSFSSFVEAFLRDGLVI